MDQRTLIVSVVEYYSYLKSIPANTVFQAFASSELLNTLLDTNKLFPQADLDFYIGMIDGMMALESDAVSGAYQHREERTALGIEVVGMLAKKHKMDDVEASRMYYASKAVKTLCDESTGYYQKSAQEMFDIIEAE